MPKFADIPKFTKTAPYRITVPWDCLEDNIERYSTYGLNLDPPFQRAHVWTLEKQIAYVEFQLRGGKSSQEIYFNHPGWMLDWKGDFVLVDGKQRIEAARKFLRNELPVFGYLKSEYEDRIPISDISFQFNINDLKTYAEVLQWYLDLNTGGVVHTSEEIDKVKYLLSQERKK